MGQYASGFEKLFARIACEVIMGVCVSRHCTGVGETKRHANAPVASTSTRVISKGINRGLSKAFPFALSTVSLFVCFLALLLSVSLQFVL